MFSQGNQERTSEALGRGSAWSFVHSALLVGAMVLLLAAVGGLLDGWAGIVFAAGVGGGLFLLSHRVSGDLILRMKGATPLSRFTAPELTDLVRVLAHRAGLSRVPRLFRVPGPAVTAFTVGTRESPAIAITDGLVGALSYREMAGVLAHEMSHVRRNDMRVVGLAAMVSQATHTMALLGQFLLLINLPLMLAGRVAVSWLAILLLLSAPALSGLLQLALSRTREYEADLGAVRLTGDPIGLASALGRLERYNRSLLASVLTPVPSMRVPSMLRTHPRTEARIERLLRIEQERERARAVAGDPPSVRAVS